MAVCLWAVTDLNSFRAALGVLQKQVSDLDRLKAEYYTEVLAHEEETWDAALEKVCWMITAALEDYSSPRLAATGSAGSEILVRSLRPDFSQIVR